MEGDGRGTMGSEGKRDGEGEWKGGRGESFEEEEEMVQGSGGGEERRGKSQERRHARSQIHTHTLTDTRTHALSIATTKERQNPDTKARPDCQCHRKCQTESPGARRSGGLIRGTMPRGGGLGCSLARFPLGRTRGSDLCQLSCRAFPLASLPPLPPPPSLALRHWSRLCRQPFL